ncbi:spore germination protein [Halalkalibacter alkaliphilus]|uniref:Spore germination protein n=1 Tax=Halalkalibacter alkaliphilus TaxID=2917993 RepID=A0A9X2CUN7_9BACI|nr:spore germination protein [Halalkalibacter alkaliphilus]MCL7748572.1 spore germination protein [Halalkalibacter alkaliphilus]
MQLNGSDTKPQNPLTVSIDENCKYLRSIYQQCSDVIFRPFLLFGKIHGMIIYIEGLSDQKGIDEHVLSPLMKNSLEEPLHLFDYLHQNLPVSNMTTVNLIPDCIESISTGNPILLIDGHDQALSLGLAQWKQRSIEEPQAEKGVRGPREGFVESLQVNTSLIRRIIKTPALKIQSIKVGKYTKTSIVIAYIEGVADKTVIEEVTTRINRINIDGILESEYIEELIEDNPYSPFPQILSTERPDITCSSLLEGRVAILTEGTPFTLIAPVTIFSLLQSQEDYYQRFLISTMIRWLRYIAFVASFVVPALYVAILTFHQEMIPEVLLLSIASSREGIPFPAFVEVLMMEIVFEVLREAGIRLPMQVGAAISIVGALVIGQAAVDAGFVSAPMLIIVALTGISSFMIPRYFLGLAVRIIRFPMIFLASALGLVGIMLGIIAIVIHLCTLRSLGEPYLTPVAPFKRDELRDALWRSPLWMMDTRPNFTQDSNYERQSDRLQPKPTK